MNDKSMNIINIILYYVMAPLALLQFILVDYGYLKFTGVIFVSFLVILFVLVLITYLYKKKNPEYEFKPNDLYTKIIFLLILFEGFYAVGFFR